MDEEEAARLLLRLDQMQHSLRLGIDGLKLLGRCLDECEMEPDLAIEVCTVLMRFTAHAEHIQRG